METKGSESAFRRYLKVILGVIIGGVSLYLALRNVSFQEFTKALIDADYSYLAWALVSVAMNTLAKSTRWQVLLGKQGSGVSLRQNIMVLLAGQALNTLYPARIGDLTRAYLIGNLGPGKVFVLGTIILEKLLDMLLYTLLFLLLLLLLPLPDWINKSVYSVTSITLVGLLLVFIVSYRVESFVQLFEKLIARFPGKMAERAMDWIRSGLASFAVFKEQGELVKLAGWSVIVWATAILTNHLTLLALNIQLPITASILVLVVLQVSLSLPSIPGRIGVFEYLCVLSLAVFGIGQASAFTYGILLHIVALLPSTLLGLVFLSIFGLQEKALTKVKS